MTNSLLKNLNLSPLYDGDGDPGAPSPDPLAPATGGAPDSQAAAPATPQAATPAPATPGAAPQGYVPSYRLRETRESAMREAREAAAQEIARIRQEADQYRSQLHAIVGVQPPKDPQADAVRQQFASLFPKLAKLEEKGEDIFGLIERSGDLEAQTTHYWQSYANQTMDRLYAHAQESLGAPLTEEGKRQLHASFTGFISSSPELSARYSQDPSIVEDFWKQFTTSFIDPVRRSSAAQVVARVPGALPQDAPSGAPRMASGPAPSNLDERAAAGWAMFNNPLKGQL